MITQRDNSLDGITAIKKQPPLKSELYCFAADYYRALRALKSAKDLLTTVPVKFPAHYLLKKAQLINACEFGTVTSISFQGITVTVDREGAKDSIEVINSAYYLGAIR